MTVFKALVVREWREWRTVIIILGLLYLIILVGIAYGARKGMQVHISSGSPNVEMQWEDDDDWDWADPWNLGSFISGEFILFGFAHSLRGTAVLIQFVMLLVGMFYMADAVYKERADGSTYFHRSLPVQDHTLLLTKFFVGTVGVLMISYLLGSFHVAIARFVVPGELIASLDEAGLSLSQIAYTDFLFDWLVYHLLVLLWISPYAAYMLLVSAATRSRPLLVGLGLPVVLMVVIGYYTRSTAFAELLLSNTDRIQDVIKWEWVGQSAMYPEPGDEIELFDSFGRYILSGRTAISLLLTGGILSAAWAVYRKNVMPSS
ncbi:MAG: hypothetical protein IID15_01460 [Candidatus Marinimicrobia bacterium]|nr:hypothetical protein [Candidatus Neomarinimicrobiota bacterium]